MRRSCAMWAMVTPTSSTVLVEKALGRVVVTIADDRQARSPAADRQLLTTGGDRLAQLVKQDLEAGETLVEEILGFQLQATRVVVGRLDDVPRPLLGSAHDLG